MGSTGRDDGSRKTTRARLDLQRWADPQRESSHGSRRERGTLRGEDNDFDQDLDGLDFDKPLLAGPAATRSTHEARRAVEGMAANAEAMDDLDLSFASGLSLSTTASTRTRSGRTSNRPSLEDNASARSSANSLSSLASQTSKLSRPSQANLRAKKSQGDLRQVIKDGNALKSIGVNVRNVPESAFSGKGVLTKLPSSKGRPGQQSRTALGPSSFEPAPSAGIDAESLDWAEDIDIPDKTPLTLSKRTRRRENTASSVQSSATDIFTSENEDGGISSSTSVHASPSISYGNGSFDQMDRSNIRKMELPQKLRHIGPDNEDAEDGFDFSDSEFMSPASGIKRKAIAPSITAVVKNNNTTPTNQKSIDLIQDLTPRALVGSALRMAKGVSSPALSTGSTPSLYESDGDLDNYDDLVLGRADSAAAMRALVTQRQQDNQRALMNDMNIQKPRSVSVEVDFTDGLVISEDNFNSMQLKRQMRERGKEQPPSRSGRQRKQAATPVEQEDLQDDELRHHEESTIRQGRGFKRLTQTDLQNASAAGTGATLTAKGAKEESQRTLRSKKSMVDLHSGQQDRSGPRIARKASMPSLRGEGRPAKLEAPPPVPSLPIMGATIRSSLQNADRWSRSSLSSELEQCEVPSSDISSFGEGEHTLRLSKRTSTVPPSSSQKATLSSVRRSRPKVLKVPQVARNFGDGTELDHFDDLPTNREKENRYRAEPVSSSSPLIARALGRRIVSSSRRPLSNDLEKGNGKGLKAVKAAEMRRHRDGKAAHGKRPMLLRNLSVSQRSHMVGQMVYNPESHRWEGNEGILQAFEAATQSPHRPALISQVSSQLATPTKNFKGNVNTVQAPSQDLLRSGAKIVGDMIFDPIALRWIKRPDLESDDEDDPFADIEDCWQENQPSAKRAVAGHEDMSTRPSVYRGVSTATITSTASSVSSKSRQEGRVGHAAQDSATIQVPLYLWRECQEADRKHRNEIAGWIPSGRGQADDRAYLYSIRQLLGLQ